MPTSQVPAGQPKDTRSRLLRVAGAAAGARAEQDLDRDRAQAGIDDPAPERGDPVERAVGVFRPVPEQSVHSRQSA